MNVPQRLLAPAPGWIVDTDVVVVGSGIAGLTTALRIAGAGLPGATPTGIRVMVAYQLVSLRSCVTSSTTFLPAFCISATMFLRKVRPKSLFSTMIATESNLKSFCSSAASRCCE